MKDLIKKYREQKIFSNLNIILVSLVLAFWVNFLILDESNLGQKLKVSVINSQSTNIKSDIYIERLEESLYIIANKDINNLSTLSLSLIYNPENTSLIDLKSKFWDIANLTNTPWVSSIILTTSKATKITKWSKLIQFNINKKEAIVENINIVNANFKDINNEHYLLSTSWITY